MSSPSSLPPTQTEETNEDQVSSTPNDQTPKKQSHPVHKFGNDFWAYVFKMVNNHFPELHDSPIKVRERLNLASVDGKFKIPATMSEDAWCKQFKARKEKAIELAREFLAFVGKDDGYAAGSFEWDINDITSFVESIIVTHAKRFSDPTTALQLGKQLIHHKSELDKANSVAKAKADALEQGKIAGDQHLFNGEQGHVSKKAREERNANIVQEGKTLQAERQPLKQTAHNERLTAIERRLVEKGRTPPASSSSQLPRVKPLKEMTIEDVYKELEATGEYDKEALEIVREKKINGILLSFVEKGDLLSLGFESICCCRLLAWIELKKIHNVL
jgi:hypothetical protein